MYIINEDIIKESCKRGGENEESSPQLKEKENMTKGAIITGKVMKK